MAAHRAGWKNAKYAQQWENTLATYAFKVIGDLPTQEVCEQALAHAVESAVEAAYRRGVLFGKRQI
ncbi:MULTISPECIES: phage integrase central domain-containing protein [unclassified Pseudomonas]|uniref:phage integrase central domain-containing protein n=1 Tax=unclassified Pseudomonas TaxID=196821 RepID=UPI0039DF5E36